VLILATLAFLSLSDSIHDFSREDASRFTCVNDTVMGGRSASKVEALDGGTLRFSGKLSLENNGGFTSFQSRGARYEIGESDGLLVRVKGDGRKYIFSIDLAGTPIPAGGYWQEFATEKDRWIDVRFPYEKFVPTSFGRELRGLDPVTPDRITGLAFYLYDKKEGAFEVEFDSIRTYRNTADAAVATGDAGAKADSGLLPAECSTLGSLLEKTGLDAAVAKLDGFTLFAPTDAAFQKLPSDVVAALLSPENSSALRKVLLHHVVAAPVTAWNAARLDSADVLDGGTVAIAKDGDTLSIGGARVTAADRLRGVGVIHVIDSVIVPPDLELVTPKTGVARLLTAAIERGVPLFNDGNIAACAAVYRTTLEAIVALGAADLDSATIDSFRAALAKAEGQQDRDAAWTLRRAMDAAITSS
jgi:NADH dehydrogenase [ubiquinone] 1 alpha subcomplex assembly factor 1